MFYINIVLKEVLWAIHNEYHGYMDLVYFYLSHLSHCKYLVLFHSHMLV